MDSKNLIDCLNKYCYEFVKKNSTSEAEAKAVRMIINAEFCKMMQSNSFKSKLKFSQ